MEVKNTTTTANTLAKKNILFLSMHLGLGGSEGQTTSLLNGLDAKDFNLHLIYFTPFDLESNYINHTNLVSFQCVEKKSKFDLSAFFKIKDFIIKNNIDIVFCVDEFPFLMGFLARLLCNKSFKLITCIHHTKPQYGLWIKFKDLIYHRLLRKNDEVIFVSENQKNYWLEENGIPSKISTVIHNGINVQLFTYDNSEQQRADLKEQIGFAQDHFIVGINAVLRKGKRHEDLIDAIKLCHKYNLKISACIIGQGVQRKTIKNYILQHEMQDYIKMVGFQKDVRPYIKLCDCMCLPSDSEAFSMSILEAMCMGKIVLSTEVGGANEVIDDGVNGYLFQPGDVKRLVELILSVAQNKNNTEQQEMQMKAKKVIYDNFSVEVMVNKYKLFFQSLT
ncbi:MAG: glycosyltransferase [Pseudomonadota bacterium]